MLILRRAAYEHDAVVHVLGDGAHASPLEIQHDLTAQSADRARAAWLGD